MSVAIRLASLTGLCFVAALSAFAGPQVSAQLGASLSGPTLGARLRFENDVAMGMSYARWGRAYAEDAGLYCLFPPGARWRGHPYVGTELFRSNRGNGFEPRDVTALLLAAGSEHRVSDRLAITYQLAAGPLLTMSPGDVLPPVTVKARAQFLCRLL